MDNAINISRDISGTISIPSLVDGSAILRDAVNDFGHIIPYGETVTSHQFASMIEEHSSNIKAKSLASSLRDVIEMTLVVYKNDKALKGDIVYKKSFAVSSVDTAESYAIALIDGDFQRLNLDNSDKQLYSQLKTPQGGNFMAGYLAD